MTSLRKICFLLLWLLLPAVGDALDRREMVALVQLAPGAMSPDGLGYSRTRPLTYGDFQGQPDHPNSLVAAQTYTEIGYRMRTRTSNLRTEALITVYVGMYPRLSWMRPAVRSPEILRHEQLHFDISALWACRMKEALDTTRFSPETLRTQLTRLHDAFNDSCAAEQARYDRETGHSINKEAQARWEGDIVRRLEAQACFR